MGSRKVSKSSDGIAASEASRAGSNGKAASVADEKLGSRVDEEKKSSVKGSADEAKAGGPLVLVLE